MSAADEKHHAGRPVSWLGVAVVVVGFVLGGLGLVLGPVWLLFWIGVGVIAVGGIFALAVGIMEDYG